MTLFSHYEQRPPACQAVLVWYDTINAIAEYFSAGGYETEYRRANGAQTLKITHSPTEHHDAFELILHLPNVESSRKPPKRAMLIYGHPPTVMDEDEFERQYRKAKNDQ